MEFKIRDEGHIPLFVAVPTAEQGDFIINHPHYGEHVVHEIELKGVDASDFDAMAIDNRQAFDPKKYFEIDPDRPWIEKIVNYVGYATIALTGSKNTVTVQIDEVKETEPLHLELKEQSAEMWRRLAEE